MTKFCSASLVLVWASLPFPPSTDAGMLRNSSFEDAAPSSQRHALHWKMHEPDEHGDLFGSASREDWRSHDGMHIMTIRGTWAHAGDYGGIWQEAAAVSGETYRASAWFWADPDWDPKMQEMKLEFFNADYSEMLKSESDALHEIPTEWERHEITAAAPDGAAWVRLVIHAEEVGYYGALQFDSVYMAPHDRFDEPTPEPVDVIIEILDESAEDGTGDIE